MTRCTATCIYPGCLEMIHYDSEDQERPLYCRHHLQGREHRGYKVNRILPPSKPPESEPMVVLKCMKKNCGSIQFISKKEWMAGNILKCSECGSKMMWHHDVKS